jgi:hypothetical protein
MRQTGTKILDISGRNGRSFNSTLENCKREVKVTE